MLKEDFDNYSPKKSVVACCHLDHLVKITCDSFGIPSALTTKLPTRVKEIVEVAKKEEKFS